MRIEDYEQLPTQTSNFCELGKNCLTQRHRVRREKQSIIIALTLNFLDLYCVPCVSSD